MTHLKPLILTLFASLWLVPLVLAEEGGSTAVANSSPSWIDKTEASADFLLGGGSYVEGPDASTYVMLMARPRAQVSFTDFFQVRAELWMNLNNSRTQTRFQSPFFQALSLGEVVASLNAYDYAKLEVGAISQGHLENPMLVDARAFPGAYLESGIRKKNGSLRKES